MNNTSVNVTASKIATGATRLYYLDWLRVMAMLTIFFFHNSRFFDDSSWHVSNAGTSLGADLFVQFCNPWLMPLFFILAGASVFYALRLRTASGFAKERVLRILIPIIILGWFIIAPPQIYLERLSHGDFTGSFLQFIPHYFTNGIYGLNDGGNFGLVPLHMWFLWLLFIFSLILLPLFLRNKETGKSLLSGLATLFKKPWTIIVPILLIPVSEVLLGPLGNMLSWGGGWNHLSYLLFFISGYMIFSNEQIQDNIRKYAAAALAGALVIQVLHYLVQFGVIQIGLPHGITEAIFDEVSTTSRSWFFIITILGFGSRYLNFNNKFLGYMNEAVLPFYIMHQTVILIIGFFVIQWGIGIGPKYLITTTTSFIAIMIIYELLVRRIIPLRFLFGMRVKKKKQKVKLRNES
ncbi:acyltransferase family protein [Chloroflexota bacterium]